MKSTVLRLAKDVNWRASWRDKDLVIDSKRGDLHCHRYDVDGGVDERWLKLRL